MYKAKEKPGIMMYWDVFAVLDVLNAQQTKAIISVMHEYARYGVEPDLGDDIALSVIWPLIRNKLDADDERYEQRRRVNSEAGKESARKRREGASTPADEC